MHLLQTRQLYLIQTFPLVDDFVVSTYFHAVLTRVAQSGCILLLIRPASLSALLFACNSFGNLHYVASLPEFRWIRHIFGLVSLWEIIVLNLKFCGYKDLGSWLVAAGNGPAWSAFVHEFCLLLQAVYKVDHVLSHSPAPY